MSPQKKKSDPRAPVKDRNRAVMNKNKLVEEQTQVLLLQQQGLTLAEIGEKMGLSHSSVKRRLSGAKKAERLDPEIVKRLQDRGVVDLAGLHSGWLLEKDKSGSGQSLYFYLGPDEEKISFADAIINSLKEIPRLEPVKRMVESKWAGKGYANWLAMADLHVGGDYIDPATEENFNWAIDDLVGRMPPAQHAVLFELGDLLEMNDHKGITPGSGNHLEVKLGNEAFLEATQIAVRLVRRALYRLLETHDTVEAHFIRGNHDETAFIAVMLALKEHFADNPRVNIVVSASEFRVVTWGRCAAFPNHGDKLKWPQLKDVWTEEFPDEWAAAKAHRVIMTAHFHHDRKQDLVGCVGEHFRTLHGPNNWAKHRGLLSRGSLTAITVHAERGEEFRTISNIRQRKF